MLGKEGVDGGLKVDERMEDVAFEAAVGFCQSNLDGNDGGG